MRNKLIAILLCIGVLCSLCSLNASAAESHKYTVAEVDDLCGGILAYKQSVCGASLPQQLINTGLCSDAGTTAEYYIICLSQSGSYDFKAYEKALLRYISSNTVYSATTREKYALALIASGSNSSYISRACDEDIGELGIMSLVFGLHLLNNGYTSSLYNVDSLINTILSYRLSDGGWAVMGDMGDVDVTAMVVQSLAPHYRSSAKVARAVDSALNLLSSKQMSDGGFMSMGAENPESAAQVLTALSALGIDQSYDTRFIKNGRTVLDAMLDYRRSDGSFSHDGKGYNENATIQALYSMTAYVRMLRGMSGLYILDRRSPSTVQPYKKTPDTTQKATAAPTEKPTGVNYNTQAASQADNTSASIAPAEHDNLSVQTPTIQPSSPQRQDVTQSVETATSADSSDDPSRSGEIIRPEIPAANAVFQPTESSIQATADEPHTSSGGYKLYAIIGIAAAAVIAAAILFAMKKRNKKHYIALLIITAAAVLIILLTNFETVDEYKQTDDKSSIVGSVTLTIRCDTIADEADKAESIPDNGIILDATPFDISDGDTVFDILTEASKKYDLQIDNRGGSTYAYIAGIQYLYEYDYGSLSGWMYRVNGVFPEVGCQSYRLSDGDSIEWLYTCDIGKDL